MGKDMMDPRFDPVYIHVTTDVMRVRCFDKFKPWDKMSLECSIQLTPQVIREFKEEGIKQALDYLHKEIENKLTPEILKMDFGEKEAK